MQRTLIWAQITTKIANPEPPILTKIADFDHFWAQNEGLQVHEEGVNECEFLYMPGGM